MQKYVNSIDLEKVWKLNYFNCNFLAKSTSIKPRAKPPKLPHVLRFSDLQEFEVGEKDKLAVESEKTETIQPEGTRGYSRLEVSAGSIKLFFKITIINITCQRFIMMFIISRFELIKYLKRLML